MHLDLDGNVPSLITGIRERLTSEQRTQDEAGNVDLRADYIFDIPVELGKVLTGFRHDEGIADKSGSDAAFQVLEYVQKGHSQKGGGLLSFLLGRRRK